MDNPESEREYYDPDDVGPQTPQLSSVDLRLPRPRSASPTIYGNQIHSDLVFDDSCEGFMSDIFPQLRSSMPYYPRPRDPDPYRWSSQMELPLNIRGMTMYARPDSGCEENIMSLKMAEDLDLPINRRARDRMPFRIANGKIVEALGRVSIWSCFPEEPWKEMRLNFYLFPRLITPLIIGMSFLLDTKVLTENRYRLRPREVRRRGPYQVSLLNNPARRLHCIAQSMSAEGNPDTGSEIDLMSLSYATRRNFEIERIEDDETEVQFADGSISNLAGKVNISLTVCSDSPLQGEMTFYVLQDLTCDLLFGEDFLHSNEIFSKHQTALGTANSNDILGANTIFWQKKGERTLAKLFSSRKRVSTSSTEGNNQEQNDDARELDRRERAAETINGLTGEERETAGILESKKIAEYDRNKSQRSGYTAVETVRNLYELETAEAIVHGPGRPLGDDVPDSIPSAAASGQTTQIDVFPEFGQAIDAVDAHHGVDPDLQERSKEVHLGNTNSATSQMGNADQDEVPEEEQNSLGMPVPRFSATSRFASPPRSPDDAGRWRLPSPRRGSGYPFQRRRTATQEYTSDAYERDSYEICETDADTDAGTDGTMTPRSIAIHRMEIDGITNPQIYGFKCVHPGCSAQPFQTQYLLNSHANVHSSTRPHYCTFKGCPRGEGGKGFKRKNEMIRHRLVHDSPGYICPFCPDREHKYPRPDMIRRHVRVHHVDKDKDDPILREVLAQRWRAHQ